MPVQMFAQIHPERVIPLKGDDIATMFRQACRSLVRNSYPLYLIGPSGSGKTVFAENLALWFSRQYDVPAFTVQLTADDTKTSLVMGFRIADGSLVPADGVVAHVMRHGGVLVVDEFTHAEFDVQQLFNTPTERNSRVSIGESQVDRHPLCRFIFCSNDEQIKGNKPIVQSLGRRLNALPFEYPSFETEVAVAQDIVERDYADTCALLPGEPDYALPSSLARFLVGYVREMREGHSEYPLCASNVAIALHNIADTQGDLGTPIDRSRIDPHFTNGDKATGIQSVLYRRIHQDAPRSSDQVMDDTASEEVMLIVSHLGLDAFRRAVMRAVGYYLPIAGLELREKQFKQHLWSSLI